MDSIPQQLLLQAILILINAFFAMTEIAVISLNPGKLRMLAEEGDKTAPKLLKLVEEPSSSPPFRSPSPCRVSWVPPSPGMPLRNP